VECLVGKFEKLWGQMGKGQIASAGKMEMEQQRKEKTHQLGIMGKY
jgi:hypothetical protein